MTFELIRPVRYGLLIGLLGFVFGIGWAFWLVLGHERIHETLEASAAAVEKNLPEEIDSGGHTDAHAAQKGHSHKDGGHGHGAPQGRAAAMASEAANGHFAGAHDNPVIELSHTRLTRGHLHAMGLSLVTVVVSFIMAFTSAGRLIKTVAPVLTGLGGLIYPLAWVVMGYRTPALGPEAAEATAVTIAAPGVALVLLGVLTAIVFLLKDVFSGR